MDAITALPGAADATTTDDRTAPLFDRHFPRLYRLARRLTESRDDALDLVQDTFLRVLPRMDAVPGDDAGAEAFLVRVLVNLRKDQWRRAAVRARHQVEARATTAHASTAPEPALLAHGDVWAALARLDPRRRAVIVMHELEGLTAAEIARQLGLAAVTVRWHLFRGRRDLQAVLRRPGEKTR